MATRLQRNPLGISSLPSKQEAMDKIRQEDKEIEEDLIKLEEVNKNDRTTN